MAPLKAVKKDHADKRVQLILDFATATAQKLQDRSTIPTNTVAELERFVKQPFPSSTAVAFARKSSDFDMQGSSLWNGATKLLREVAHLPQDDEPAPKIDFSRLAVLLRAFAFYMLDAAHNTSSRRSNDYDQRIRIFKVAIKASRCCLNNDDLDTAFKILEVCSKYLSSWEDTAPVIRVAGNGLGDDDSIVKRLESEYYLLRMTHSSKSGRLDLADHFFAKVNNQLKEAHQDLIETAAETCYEIGRLLRRQKDEAKALSWLDHAYQLLDSISTEFMPLENEDLLLAIVASYVDSLMATSRKEDVQRAWEVLEGISNAHGIGDRTAVQAMRLKVAMRLEPVDYYMINAIVLRMIRSTVLTAETFRILMQVIHRVKKISLHSALDALELLINSRLLPDLDVVMDGDQVRDWLERAIVTHTDICLSAMDDENLNTIEKMARLFDNTSHNISEFLSPKATHAMQALIWRTLKSANGAAAESLLNVLQHQLFSNVGATNKARVARKAMLIALERGETDKARGIFYELHPSAHNEGPTRYIGYKLALRSSDVRLASECLSALVKHDEKDRRYLYACALEAQQSGNRAMALAAFQALLVQPPTGVQLPALLRCTARLLMEELESSTENLNEAAHELARALETAAENFKTFRRGPEDQYRAEIQWWCKNAFNTALRLCAEVDPEHLARLLKACRKFLDLYPEDMDSIRRQDVVSRKQICHFLTASTLIVLGRSTNDRAMQLQYYLDVQREVKAFQSIWEPTQHQTDGVQKSHARAMEMLKFNIESVFRLEQWDNIDEALTACLDFQGTARWDALADLVIVIHNETKNLSIDSSATAKMPALLQRIINETWQKDKNIVKLARWLRFNFSIELNDDDGDTSIKLVEQAATLAKRGADMRNDPYPEDELQWLATTAFNKAVDLLVSGDRAAAERWIEAALELARYAADNGTLHAHLTKNREEAERRMKRR